jgi:hypothetical protein
MTMAELDTAIKTAEPQHIGELRPDLAPETAEMIMQMLKKRPHQRPGKLSSIIALGTEK